MQAGASLPTLLPIRLLVLEAIRDEICWSLAYGLNEDNVLRKVIQVGQTSLHAVIIFQT